MEILWTGFLLGFLGSAHCAGMCGPIAIALPGKNQSAFPFISGRVIYNSGRMLTYMFLGLFTGLIGLGAALAGYQQAISIVAGVAIIIVALLPGARFQKFLHASPAMYKGWFGQTFRNLISSGSKPSLFGIGVMNGFLPCGFVYLALAGSVATASPVAASLYMGLFGLGTFPVMMAMSVAPKFVNSEWRFKMQKALPYVAVLLGCILILRGMSLGIPFLSPDLTSGAMDCH